MVRERDWTPAVLTTGSLCILVVGMVWMGTPWLRGRYDGEPGPAQARRLPPAEIAAWVGEVAPDVTAVLAPVWGDPAPDRFHDEELNRTLGLRGGRSLSWFRLLLVNVATEDRTVDLGAGALRVRAAETANLSDVSAMASRGEVRVPGGIERVLGALGALGGRVNVPGGTMVPRLVAFDRAVDLSAATAVERADGTPFHRRPMARAELQSLLYDAPDEDRVKDL